MQELIIGKEVKINTPENPLLHGQVGIIKEITDYGAIVRTLVGSGEFRALTEEIILEGELAQTNGVHISKQEPTGNCCGDCGSTRMVRTGTCETCQDCGRSSGC